MLNKIKKLFKFSTAAAVTLALLFSAAYFGLRSEYAGRLASKLLSGYSGGEVSVRSVSGNFIRRATLNGVRIGPARDGSVRSFTAESVSVAYSILNMARNWKPGLGSCELSNARLELSAGAADLKISPQAVLETIKSEAARIFYNGSVPFYLGRISANRLTIAFDGLKKPAGPLLHLSALKIVPRNIFMSSCYFETLAEMLHDGASIIPSCRIKGEIDFNAMAFRIYLEAERVRLSDFGWLLERAAPGLRIDDGTLFISAVINYSQQDGLSAFGNAVAKNLAVNFSSGGHKFVGELINANFNEDSLKLIRSRVSIDDFPFQADATISSIFSRDNLKAGITLRAPGTPAEKALSVIRKLSGFDAGEAYYATGAVDATIRIDGAGPDISRWKHKTAITLNAVDIASQKISLAFERITGKIEGENGSFRTAAPITMKIGGRWHQLSAEIKNAGEPANMSYGCSCRESAPAKAEETVVISGDDKHFIVFDYDENDEEWGGWNNDNLPTASMRVSVSRNARGRFASGSAVFNNIFIDGLFGLRRAKADATLTLKSNGAHFNDLTISQPDGEYRGELKISFERPARYELRLQPTQLTTNGTARKPDAIKLSGTLKSIGEDLKTIFKYDTASREPAGGEDGIRM